jgi:hypothetical protein
LLGLLGTGALVTAGCGDDEPAGTGGSGGSGAETSSSSTTGVTSVSSSVSSTGAGAAPDGNDSFETAEELVDVPHTAELSPTGDVDFYKFQGNKGDALYIDIDAQTLVGNTVDDTIIDTIVTLYDADEKQIAQNTNFSSYDRDPRLYTVLPADGTYYLRVTECFTWADDTGVCGGDAEKDYFEYELYLFPLDPASEQNVIEEEPNDATAEATPMTYLKLDDGSAYYTSFVWGDFSAATDVDIFKFTPPADITTIEGRSSVEFTPTQPGVDASGSTTSVGRLAIVDPAAPTVAVAEIDATHGAFLWAPLTLGKEYWLYVQHPDTAAGAHDFYFYLHSIGGSNPLEMEEATNDVVTTPEVLSGEPNGTLYSYFLEGDLISNAADVDHYRVDVTTLANSTIAVACAGRWYGSGLRDLKWEVLDETTGMPITGATATEPVDDNAYKGDIVIPAGATNVIVKVSAASQAADVTGSFYRCGVHLVPN